MTRALVGSGPRGLWIAAILAVTPWIIVAAEVLS